MTEPAPPLTVAMSVYNAERFLAPAIESILAQSFGDFEFLILDDGSRDATASIAAHYGAQDKRIRLISRENRGLIASLNQLLGEARAQLIARMDGDDISHPERFERQVRFMESHPEVGVVGSWTEDIDENGTINRLTGSEHPVDHEGFLAAVDPGLPLLCHPAVLYRRDVVRSVGGYHPAFAHCEDFDLWLRLASVTRIANIPERLLYYRRSSDQVSNRHATRQQVGAAIARMAYAERRAGRPDPTEKLTALPAIEELDALFGRPGVSAEVCAKVAPGLLYSRSGLSDDGFHIICRFIREGGRSNGLWRTVLRLISFGEVRRAAVLALALSLH
ncbi:MAG: glycosyltransferase [Novosphingobium sp.]|nr:glycosyltransferase [Novosphingobium sp.]